MIDGKKVKTLTLGDMTGHMFLADMVQKDTHPTSLLAETDGVMACLPLGELKAEQRKSPEAVFMIMKVVAKCAMETFYYNLYGVEHNPLTRHPSTAQMSKKLKDFYFKNE